MGKYTYIESLPPNACYNPAQDPYVTQKKPYKRVAANGTSFICTPEELPGMIDDEAEYTITDVMMTECEVDALPEFQGF